MMLNRILSSIIHPCDPAVLQREARQLDSRFFDGITVVREALRAVQGA